jgi:hypothetical protein
MNLLFFSSSSFVPLLLYSLFFFPEKCASITVQLLAYSTYGTSMATTSKLKKTPHTVAVFDLQMLVGAKNFFDDDNFLSTHLLHPFIIEYVVVVDISCPKQSIKSAPPLNSLNS